MNDIKGIIVSEKRIKELRRKEKEYEKLLSQIEDMDNLVKIYLHSSEYDILTRTEHIGDITLISSGVIFKLVEEKYKSENAQIKQEFRRKLEEVRETELYKNNKELTEKNSYLKNENIELKKHIKTLKERNLVQRILNKGFVNE